jgi:hypothetical protein
MLTVTDSVSVAANTTDQNVFQTNGNRVRTIPAEFGIVRITLYETGSATGLQSSFFNGNNNPIENSLVNVQNRVPVVPDDIVATDMFGRGGEQLQLQATNTTAGALTYFYRVEIEELSDAELQALGV